LVSTATDIATRTAVGVGVGFGCGWSSGDCFWDPSDNGHCGPLWDWWCSPGWAWWWSSCASPWWGYGWGFGYWSDNCGFWYGGWPGYYASYPVAYYAPYPAYYSAVIYDSYDQAPSETVYVSEPAESYSDQPVAEGEGSIRVAGDRAADGRGPIQSTSSHFLNLGDQAFRESRYSDAVHYYAKAVDLEPGLGVLHLILSDALFATGDYHYAAYALRRALELDPTLVDSIVDKHAFYSEPSDFDRQLELLERYLGDHFLDDDARLLLAANYLFGGKPAQAMDLLQSPFSVAIRESGAGRLLLDRAQRLRETTGSQPAVR
jgi:tetratricopeptide (TPR) repeat protein